MMHPLNLRTETEAKQLWCPMVTVSYLPGGSVQRDGKPAEVPDIVVTNRGEVVARLGDKPIPCNCIASGCGVWIWAEDVTPSMPEVNRRGRCGAARL
jgi:hypothetical protein